MSLTLTFYVRTIDTTTINICVCKHAWFCKCSSSLTCVFTCIYCIVECRHAGHQIKTHSFKNPPNSIVCINANSYNYVATYACVNINVMYIHLIAGTNIVLSTSGAIVFAGQFVSVIISTPLLATASSRFMHKVCYAYGNYINAL